MGTYCLLFFATQPQAWAQIYELAEMRADQIDALDRSTSVVIIPGGILEQHGPYAPSFSDGYVNERLAQRLAEAIVGRSGWSAIMFPQIPLGVGAANEIGRKYPFGGSYTVRFATLRSVFMDLATELGEQGFRWIFVVHRHGAPNHNRALEQAGDYFHDTFGGEMVSLTGVAIDSIPDLRTETEQLEDGLGIHAGMNETSLIMFLRPDLVAASVTEVPPWAGPSWDELVRLATSDDWPGYLGSPRLATAAHGARYEEALATALGDLAVRILDGYDYRQIPRYSDLGGSSPANVAIDQDALDRDREIEERQRNWLVEAGFEGDVTN